MDLQKTEPLAIAIFDLLNSNIQYNNSFNNIFVRRCIANSIYDQGPKIRSGLISVKAKEAVLEGKILKKHLCYEHPYPRTRTALDCISIYENTEDKPENKITKINEALYNGCKTHLVLSEENRALYPFQQDYSLSEEEIYSKAGVVLVEDDLKVYPYTYTHNGVEYNSIPELATLLNTSEYKINKMVKDGTITKKKNF